MGKWFLNCHLRCNTAQRERKRLLPTELIIPSKEFVWWTWVRSLQISWNYLTMGLGFSWWVVAGKFCWGFFAHCWNFRCILMGNVSCGIFFYPLMNWIKLQSICIKRGLSAAVKTIQGGSIIVPREQKRGMNWAVWGPGGRIKRDKE